MNIFLFSILIILALLLLLPGLFPGLFSGLFSGCKCGEGFTNYTLGQADGEYPFAQTSVLVQDEFPLTGNKGVSNETAGNMWWRYPVFEVGSYDQITNNIRYSNNPDVGKCTPGDICFALYKDRQHPSNYVKPLPPVNPDCGTRVGYFATDVNLLPYRTNTANILY